jgi:hypothetical protein
MAEFLLLMHNDFDVGTEADWAPYLASLQAAGVFRGGSAIGNGICVRRAGAVEPISERLVGYVKIEARDLDHVRELVSGNPVYEAGGTVEIRELPQTD